MPNYGAVMDAFYGQRSQRMAQGDRRRAGRMDASMKQLAGRAAMGDPQALEQLMQVNPQLGMQIRKDADTRAQQRLATSATEVEGLTNALKYAAQFETSGEAIQGLQMNTDFMGLPESVQQQLIERLDQDTLTGLRKGFGTEEEEKDPLVKVVNGVGMQYNRETKQWDKVFDVQSDGTRKPGDLFRDEKDALKWLESNGHLKQLINF